MVMAKAVVRGSLISFGLAGALCALATQAVGAPYVVPGSKAAGLESCVEPTDFMRRNHMEVIKHQRDETVHNGIRSTKHSLAGCVECHASHSPEGAVVAVDEKGQFCQACHAFAAVGMDCFDCHATVPAHGDLLGQASPSLPGVGGAPAEHGAEGYGR
jgi:predicted CXXCH cytochrome family protein